jgi:hypothetical protein
MKNCEHVFAFPISLTVAERKGRMKGGRNIGPSILAIRNKSSSHFEDFQCTGDWVRSPGVVLNILVDSPKFPAKKTPSAATHFNECASRHPKLTELRDTLGLFFSGTCLCNLVNSYQRFVGTCCLHHQRRRQEAASSSVTGHLSIRTHIPEDSNLHSHHRESLLMPSLSESRLVLLRGSYVREVSRMFRMPPY